MAAHHPAAPGLGQGLCKRDPIAFNHEIEIQVGTVQQEITDEASNHVR
jgi:hypothetical protein